MSAVLLTVLGAGYGWLTTARGTYSAEVAFNFIQSNAITLQGLDAPIALEPAAEASRFATELSRFSSGNEGLVTIQPSLAGKGIVVKATGDTAAAAETLALSTAETYVDERRSVGADFYRKRAAFERSQADEISDRLSKVNEDLARLEPGANSLALEGERVQLFVRLLDAGERIAAADTNAERFDAGLTDPVLTDPAVGASSSGWVVFAIVGAILGLLFGVGLALLANAVDHRIRSRADIESLAGLPVLAVLGRQRDDHELASLDARLAHLRGEAVMTFLVPRGEHELPEGVPSALPSNPGVIVVDDVNDVAGSEVVLVARSGATTDADMASQITDLGQRGLRGVGVVLWDVPVREMAWARRPALAVS